jgi:hypothetical protein
VSNINPEPPQNPRDDPFFTPPVEGEAGQLSIPGMEKLNEQIADVLKETRKQPSRPYSGGILDVRIKDFDKTAITRLEASLAAQLQNVQNIMMAGISPSVQSVQDINATYEKLNRTHAQTKGHTREIIGLEDVRNKRAKDVHDTLQMQTDELVKQLGFTKDVKSIRYRFLNETNVTTPTDPITEEQARQAIEATKKAQAEGRANVTEDEIRGEQILQDLTARRLDSIEQIRRKKIETVRSDAKAAAEEEKHAQKAEQLIRGRSTKSLLRDLESRGILKRAPGQVEPQLTSVTALGDVIQAETLNRSQIKDLLDHFHEVGQDTQKLAEKYGDQERARLIGLEQTIQGEMSRGAARNTFNVKETLSALASGDWGTALREGTQALPMFGGLAQSGTRAGESLMTRGLAARGLSGLLQRGLGAGLMRSPLLLSPAGIFGGYEVAQRLLGQRRATTEIGQLTGQGAMAGIGARFQAFTQGINPFDMLSGRTAMEIQRAVRSEGYGGGAAGRISGTLGDLVNKGIGDWQTNLQTLSVALANSSGGTKQLDETLATFSHAMGDLRNMSRETNISVADLSKGFQGFVQQIVQSGGSLETATKRYEALHSAVAGIPGFQGTIGQQTFDQWAQTIGPMAQIATGTAPWNVSVGTRQALKALDTMIEQIRIGKPAGIGWHEYARMLEYFARTAGAPPILVGLSAAQIYGLLTKGSASMFENAGRQTDVNRGIDTAHSRESAISTGYDRASAVAGMSGNNAQVNQVFGNEQRAEQTYIRTLAQTLKNAGQSKAQIDRILAPLYQTEITRPGQSNDPFQDAQKRVEDVIHHIKIDLTPSAKRHLTARSDKERNWYYGTGSGVGVTRNDG